MEDFLNCRDLADPLEKKGVRPDSAKEEDWNKLNKKTVGHIRQWIDHSVFHHVAQETDAYTLWKKLEDMFQAKTAMNKVFLMKKLTHKILKSGEAISEHISQFQNLLNQLISTELS